MPVVVVANPKGGVDKSTLSTSLAGYFASRGQAVMLGDVDPPTVVGAAKATQTMLWVNFRFPYLINSVAPKTDMGGSDSPSHRAEVSSLNAAS